MSDINRLLVPMYMEALVLSKDKEDCVDLSPQFKNYTQCILGDVLQPTGSEKLTLEKGIHLHWTLPKALKHSFLDAGTGMAFPAVPNRWMVIRIRTDNTSNNPGENIVVPESRIWVVESDCINETEFPNQPGITPLLNPNLVSIAENTQGEKSLVFKNIGKSSVFDDTYQESPASSDIVTAVSEGNPFFSSFYPGCRNIFGFHDDLSDLTDISPDSTFTYIVTGWYSNPASDDPLRPLDFTGDPQTDEQKNRKRELDWFQQQWLYTGNSTDKSYPGSCLLHSSINSIAWNNNNTPDSGVPSGQIAVSAGNTSIEALSALMRKSKSDSNPAVEELLNALQYQLLEDDHNPPGMSAIKDEIHKRGFSAKNGGTIWEITRAEASDQQLADSTEKRSHFPTDPGILKDLKQLNDLQVQLNSIIRQTASWQQEYHFLWYKNVQKIKKLAKNTKTPSFDYDNSRKTTLSQINNNTGKITIFNQQIDDLKKKINAYSEMSGSTPEFILCEKQEERFWEPNEPALLLSGDGIGNVNDAKAQIGGNGIYCRTKDQLIDQLSLSVPNIPNSIGVSILATDFDVDGFKNLTTDTIFTDEIEALTREALLFDSGLSIEIALLAYQKAQLGEGKDTSSIEVSNFAGTVGDKQQNLLNPPTPVDHKSLANIPPALISINICQQAWSPLFMKWSVNFHPCYKDTDIAGLDIVYDNKYWELEDNLFYKNNFFIIDNSIDSLLFNNVCPLSTAVFENQKRVLPNELVNGTYGKNVIAQSLSGLNKVLLMQNPNVQLPPFIYDIPEKFHNCHTDYILDQDELNLIGPDGYRLGSLPGPTDFAINSTLNTTVPSPFYPFRAGLLQIVSLSIVDAFGQEKLVINGADSSNPTITCAGNMIDKPISSALLSFPLAPRMLQPSRLQFHWLNAQDEIVYQDAGALDNPVFGWMVPNFLDDSLMIYDGSGNEVAILQITSDITQKNGLSLEKNPFPGSAIIPDLSTTNPHLQKFMDALNTGSAASGLIDLALKVNLNITGTNAMHNNTGALLCGQPLALARCSIQLELFGLPAFNQRWDQSGKQNTAGIETVKIPLFFGDYNKDKDGLIGYFLDTEPLPPFYTTTNAPPFNSSEDAFFNNTPVKISVQQGALKMTLLLDPSAGIHISSGILPTKFVELFYHNSNELLNSLDIGFTVAPFIAEKVDPGIPAPTSINGDWKWTHKSDVATWQKDTEIAHGKDKQLSSFKKQMVYEGWLKLSNFKSNS